MAGAISQRTDRCFAVLMVLQWVAALALAIWVTPRTWIGAVSTPGPYVAVALIGGGIISLTPAVMAWLLPGERLTRHVIAAGQMLMSTLLIHLSGGRIETHFHIFGSLAFLAMYLDWTVLLSASAVVLVDHTLSNFLWPHTIFGPGAIERFRWLEHAGWVVFCDAFLIASCMGRARNLRRMAEQSFEQEKLLRQAYTDALTGMPNRLRFQREMEAAIARAEETGIGFEVMYVDLDRFKEVNDTHGHAMGDRVLLEVAARLSNKMPDETLFARIGGDEFVAICPRTGERDAPGDRAREVLTSLLLPIDVEGQMLSIGASIGLSRYPEDGVDEDQLLHHADSAMYNVKRKGRRGYSFYDPAMDAQEAPQERTEAEARLRKALERDEFSLYYQPLLNTGGRLEGLEALVRWPRPGHGMVSPGEFIPLAEATGLITLLGQVVIEKVCRQTAEWKAAGVEFGHVAINLSPRQLEEGDFLTSLDRTMARYGTEASWITFEITESACVASDKPLKTILEALRARGIRVALDDFGTGYSSLGRLQEMSFNTLKIDQIFISRLGQSETGYGVVAGIINIAHLMGMSVVAEGVENAVQWNLLREMHCDVLQGYHMSRPLPAREAGEFIQRLTRSEEPAVTEEFEPGRAPALGAPAWGAIAMEAAVSLQSGGKSGSAGLAQGSWAGR